MCHAEFISASKILKQVQNDKVSGFTLAEVLITLAIIGVVAALTIPVITKRAFEQEAVSKVKKHYRNIADAVQQWQVEEGCTDNIKGCIEKYEASDCKSAFAGIESKLKIIDRRYGGNLSNVKWLPEEDIMLDTTQSGPYWIGVTQKHAQSIHCHYLLADGTIMVAFLPYSRKQSGEIWIDINGPKKPNRVGKDVFQIGLGAYENPKYTTVHPYYAADITDSYGLCLIRENRVCDPDVCTQTSCSPTAYVLKHGKLPPITW